MYTRLYNSNNNQSNSNNNQSNSNNNQSNSKKKNNTNQNDEYKQNKIILISSDFDVEYVTINNKNKIIKLVKRSNLIIRNIEDYKFNRLLESVEKKYHYVSINSTINNIVDNHIVTFDLYRIKLNVELPNISISKFDEINKNKLIFKSSNNNLYNISIPAEFLDISIPKFNDINLSKFRDNFNLESFNTFFSILNFTDNDISYLNIITYSLEYLLDDLNLVLFKQNTFMPWIDSKYEKRINRLCCLSLLLIIKNSKKYGFKSAKIQNQNINENQQLVSKTNRNQFKYGNKIKNIIEDLSLLKDNFKKNHKNIKLNKSNTDKTNNIIKKNIKNNINDCLFNPEIITNFLHSNKYFNFDNNNHYIKNIFSDSFEFIYNIINLEINGDKNNSLTKYLIYKLKQYNYTFLNESIKSTYVSFTYKENFITFLETYIKWLTYWNNKFFDKNNIFNEIDFDSINIII